MKLSKPVRQAILERAMCQCECNIDTHDHGFNECHRKPRHFVFKENAPHASLPGCVMVVCSYCRTQIRLARG